MPSGLIGRTLAIGLPVLALLGSIGGLLLWLYLRADPPTLTRMVAFMIGYGAVFGLLVGPVVVLAALGDTSRSPTPQRHLPA